jgi:hypothetical protein
MLLPGTARAGEGSALGLGSGELVCWCGCAGLTLEVEEGALRVADDEEALLPAPALCGRGGWVKDVELCVCDARVDEVARLPLSAHNQPKRHCSHTSEPSIRCDAVRKAVDCDVEQVGTDEATSNHHTRLRAQNAPVPTSPRATTQPPPPPLSAKQPDPRPLHERPLQSPFPPLAGPTCTGRLPLALSSLTCLSRCPAK